MLSCNPVDDNPEQNSPEIPEIPEIPETGNAEENNTPEISAEENGYDGLTADDKNADKVITGNDAYWENHNFGTSITVTYSGTSATVKAASGIKSYISGADVALDLTGTGEVEIIASGKSEDGQLKIYGNSPVKLVLDGLELTSAKSAAINVQNKSSLFIHLADGTENVLCDAKSQSEESYYPEGVTADD